MLYYYYYYYLLSRTLSIRVAGWRVLMQDEDRLRRQCEERCAKVVREGRCVQKSHVSSGDGRATAETSPCNGSPPSVPRGGELSSSRSVDDYNESV